MEEPRARNLIRVLVGAVLCAALASCVAAPIPAELPAIALQQAGLYRLEIALFVFYGGLLLVTPAFSGLILGRLPIEISTRGAKFAEEAIHSDEGTETTVHDLEQTVNRLADRVTNAEATSIAAEKEGDNR